MEVQFFIDPKYLYIMQIIIYLCYILSLVCILTKKWNLFFSGMFLAVVDPRFMNTLIGYNISLILLYSWALIIAFMFRPVKTSGQTLVSFISVNKLTVLYFAIIYIFLISIIQIPNSAIKTFILIYAPYLIMLPLALTLQKSSPKTMKAKYTFMRGLQIGYLVFISLTHIYAPGNVTGALGDISVSATIVAIYCSYAIFITIIFILTNRKIINQLFDIALMVFFSVSLLMTYSRGPFVALMLSSVVMLYVISTKYVTITRKVKLVGLSVVIALIVLMIFRMNVLFEHRNISIGSNIITSGLDQFQASRYRLILEVVDFKQLSYYDLVIGKGIGASEQISRTYGHYRIESFWFEAAYDIGIAGMILLVTGLLLNIISILKNKYFHHNTYSLLYVFMFVFTLLLSPFSFGWFLQGSSGFIYAIILLLACSNLNNKEKRCRKVYLTCNST